jgi:hypothetical protein
LEELQSAIRLRGGAGLAFGSSCQVELTDEDLQNIFDVLCEIGSAVEKFQVHLCQGQDILFWIQFVTCCALLHPAHQSQSFVCTDEQNFALTG